MRTFTASLIAAVLVAGGARSQEPLRNAAEVLSGITSPVRYVPPAQVQSVFNFDCDGSRYSVELLEVSAEGADLRRVSLGAVETPSGPLAAADRARMEEELDSYFLMFGVTAQCRAEVMGLTFTGRRREDVDNSHFVAWFENGRLTGVR